MKKIIEYMIAEGTQSNDLCEVVNNYIKNGWQPWGSTYTVNQGNTDVYQPLVRYEAEL